MAVMEPRLLLWLTVLLCCSCCVRAGEGDEEEDPVLEIVEAPMERMSELEGYEKYEQGSAAWACAALDVAEPQLGYSDLESYLNGGNVDDQQMMEDVVLYPLQEIYSEDDVVTTSICIYLQRQDHCYPPKPTDAGKISIRKQFEPMEFFAIRYWGQSSTARTIHYQGALLAALGEAEEEFDEDYYIVSYFPNHVRELRYDAVAAEAEDEEEA